MLRTTCWVSYMNVQLLCISHINQHLTLRKYCIGRVKFEELFALNLKAHAVFHNVNDN